MLLLTVEALVEMLSQQTGMTVVDKTGLTGIYNYELSWVPSEDGVHLMGLQIPGPAPDGGGQSPQSVAPSIFSALREQLGLKLEKHKEPADVIVIDQLDKPSAN